MVKPGRIVAGKVLGIGTAIVVVLGAAYVFRSSDAGSKILESIKGAGDFGGKVLLAPIQGLISGVSAGTGQLTQEAAKIGSNLGSFGDALQKGDFASIVDGSYVDKYAGPGLEPTPSNNQQDFTKDTISNEQPNDKSSTNSNFNPKPTSNTNVNVLDIFKSFVGGTKVNTKGTTPSRLTQEQIQRAAAAVGFPSSFYQRVGDINTKTQSGQFVQQVNKTGAPVRSIGTNLTGNISGKSSTIKIGNTSGLSDSLKKVLGIK